MVKCFVSTVFLNVDIFTIFIICTTSTVSVLDSHVYIILCLFLCFHGRNMTNFSRCVLVSFWSLEGAWRRPNRILFSAKLRLLWLCIPETVCKALPCHSRHSIGGRNASEAWKGQQDGGETSLRVKTTATPHGERHVKLKNLIYNIVIDICYEIKLSCNFTFDLLWKYLFLDIM